MKKAIQRFIFAVLILLFISAAGFFTWAETPSQPGTFALEALKSDPNVQVTDHGTYISFEPIGQNPTTAFAAEWALTVRPKMAALGQPVTFRPGEQ